MSFLCLRTSALVFTGLPCSTFPTSCVFDTIGNSAQVLKGRPHRVLPRPLSLITPLLLGFSTAHLDCFSDSQKLSYASFTCLLTSSLSYKVKAPSR